MKKINSLIDGYTARKGSLVLENLNKAESLKKKINVSKLYLQKLRLETRERKFESTKTEISFFKHIKPKLCAELKLHCAQLSYLIEKPNSTVCRQVAYIKSELKKLESKKRKNISFYRYYKHSETVLDDKYFLRGNVV